MVDKMTPQQRHHCMSSIKGKDTRPEIVVRQFLWSHGYRYRLHRKNLPGRPDIVIGRLKVVIFVNGCFWHGHSCQKRSPETNKQYWHDKIYNNRIRDYKNHSDLESQGWLVIVLWECQLTRVHRRQATLDQLLATLRLLEHPTLRPYQLPTADDDVPTLAAEDPEIYG